MSTQPPSPGPFAPSLGRVDYICIVLFLAAIAGVVAWALCGAPKFWGSWSRANSVADSVVVDARRDTNGGHVVEFGRIYSQARIDCSSATELVLPTTRLGFPRDGEGVSPSIAVAVRAGGESGVVQVLTEVRVAMGGHFGRSIKLSESGRGTAVEKRRVGSVLTVDVAPGSVDLENAIHVRVTFVVSSGQRVRQSPPAAPEFLGSFKQDRLRWRTTDEHQKTVVWEAVPLEPLPHDQFR